jgi:hypothetical protein
MSAFQNASACTDANVALAQAIEYEEVRTTLLEEDNFKGAAHAERRRDEFFNRACELELAGA